MFFKREEYLKTPALRLSVDGKHIFKTELFENDDFRYNHAISLTEISSVINPK